MRITGVELRRARLPLLAPFRASFGTVRARDVLFVRVVTGEGEGWGECMALDKPVYSSDYIDAAAHVLRHVLIPAVLTATDVHAVSAAMSRFRGHLMAKAALETAVLDAELRSAGMTLTRYLGGTRERVPAGLAIGITDSVGELLDAVAAGQAAGYHRIKLKIEPGWDVEPVNAVREKFGSGITLQVDGNAAYTLADAWRLAQLDDHGLAMIEQPLPPDDLRGHAMLAQRIRTPVCLDESISSARAAATAIALGACSIVNIKPAQVGGYLEARRVHDVCQANGVPVWCGGMFETGIARAANLALATLPGFTIPGDISPPDRYFAPDVTAAFGFTDGYVDVPSGPGIGVTPIPEVLTELTTDVQWIPGG